MSKRTIWQMFCDLWSKRSECNDYDPLNACILTIDVLGLREHTFTVLEKRKYGLDYGKKSFPFTDYICHSTLQDIVIDLRLRFYSEDDKVLVLRQWDELEYDEGFKELLEDEEFNVEDEKVLDTFWRINGVKSPYRSMCNGVEVWYWDYWRETKDEGGSEFKEFLFVEWDKGDTGRFVILRGELVPKNKIFA